MLRADRLHDVEIGEVKKLITHLIRILHTVGEDAVQQFNARFALVSIRRSPLSDCSICSRFRKVPVFGRNTIRRFTVNVSELPQFAAHNYEDVFQVCRFTL